jgi:hypothetical protein
MINQGFLHVEQSTNALFAVISEPILYNDQPMEKLDKDNCTSTRILHGNISPLQTLL